MAKKRIHQRLADWFGSESSQAKAKKEYESGKEAAEMWQAIPEEKKNISFHSFQNLLSVVWKKCERGGKRPRSGQRKKS